MSREFTMYTSREVIISPSFNERFKQLENLKHRKEHLMSVFARLGPPKPSRMFHAVREKSIGKRGKSKKETFQDLDYALDDYMNEDERTKKRKLDEELSQYVAERKSDGSN